jgi:hypothetical protein
MTMTTAKRTRVHGIFLGLMSLGLAGLSLGAGCTKAGRSLVVVDVTASAELTTTLASVTVIVTHGSDAPVKTPFSGVTSWQGPNRFGVYVSSGVEGTVMVSALGADKDGTNIAVSMQTQSVMVVPGKATAPVAIALVPGNDGTGGAGGGGGVGMSGGSGGAAGPGTGGAIGPGTGGVTGPGTGGIGPGTGGAGAGSGGIGPGSGGAAGTTASGGTGGGSGGAGAAGASGRAWQGAMLAENNDLMSDYYPALAVDANGNVVVVYTHGSSLWANHFDATTGMWGTEGPIDASSMTNVSSANVAVDKNGNWLVVWQQDSDIPQHGIWQSTSTDGIHWTAPAAISTAGALFVPIMAMNQDGLAIVVWTENVPPDNTFVLTGSARVNGTWSAPHVLLAAVDGDSDDRNPAVTVSGTGTGIVSWEEDDKGTAAQLSVWQARFTAGTWSTAALVESYDGGQSFSAGAAANNAGQSIITWIEDTSSTSQLWAQRFPASGTPEAPVMVAEGGNIAYTPSPSVTLDDSGAATVAWAFDVKSKFDVYTARAVWGQPWLAPMAMETDDDAADDNMQDFEWVTDPFVGHDAVGNVVLGWRKRTGARFDMWARNYSATTSTWGPATLLETMDTNNVYSPTLAVGPNGVAVTSWYYGYQFDIWANVYR